MIISNQAEDICVVMSDTQDSGSETLYERLGGAYGIAGAVDDLVERLYHNTALNENPATREFHMEGGEEGFKYLVTAWSIEATGGPDVYPGRDMEDAHTDLEVSDREFDMVYRQIEQSLNQVGVPERETDEFMEIIESYRDMVVYDRDYEEDPGFVESPASY
jgi:hemoglobin